MKTRIFVLFHSLFFLGMATLLLSNASPGWIKYPDSHFYLNLAMNWSGGELSLDDGTGAFVRPVAYAIQGFGYALGGFDGLYTFQVIFSLLLVAWATWKKRSWLFFSLMALAVSSPIFVGYANTILLQLPLFGCVAACAVYASRASQVFNYASFVVAFGLIVSTFIHGGGLFIWFAYVGSLMARAFLVHVRHAKEELMAHFVGLVLHLLLFISVVVILDILFVEDVFYHLLKESGYTNRPADYYPGAFFVAVSSMLSRVFGVNEMVPLAVFFAGAVHAMRCASLRNHLPFAFTWMMIFVLSLEVLTLLGVMKRSPFASEYMRVYFGIVPVFVLFVIEEWGYWWGRTVNRVDTILNHASGQIVSWLGKSTIVLIVTVHGFERVANDGYRFTLSEYHGIREFTQSELGLENIDNVLVLPANVYLHRRFVSHADFLGSRATYWADICRSGPVDPATEMAVFSHILVISEPRLLDSRENEGLIAAGCDPDEPYTDVIRSLDYTEIYSHQSGKLYASK